MENRVIKTCSGCGRNFESSRPNNYYQFCSHECREIVQDESDDIIDNQHFLYEFHCGMLLSNLIRHYIKTVNV